MKIKFTASLLPLSPLIRLFTWSKCSHCELEFSDGVIITAAMELGMVIATRRTHRWEYTYDIPATVEQEKAIREWAESQLGVPYDYTALAPFNVLIPRKKKQWKDHKLWMCSEFCAYALELAGMKLFPDNAKKIKPSDLYNKFKK